MVFWKLMVVEIFHLRVVLVAHVHHRNAGVRQFPGSGLAADNGHAVVGEQDTAGKKLVFVRAAGVGEDQGVWHWMNGGRR
jgi:hypothetical protein